MYNFQMMVIYEYLNILRTDQRILSVRDFFVEIESDINYLRY
jgi:hypothetical protein